MVALKRSEMRIFDEAFGVGDGYVLPNRRHATFQAQFISGMTATVTVVETADGEHRIGFAGALAAVEARLSDVFDGPPARPGCIPAITTEHGATQSLPVEQADPALSPGRINPGLTPGMSDSPR